MYHRGSRITYDHIDSFAGKERDHIEAFSAVGEDISSGAVVAIDDQRFKGLRRGGSKRS